MPRMSKKRRLEWSFFLNHRNRITYNDLCRGCTHGCKQSFRAIKHGASDYISKPVQPDELLKKINEALDRKSTRLNSSHAR